MPRWTLLLVLLLCPSFVCGGVVFDGVDDLLTVANQSLFQLADTSFTVCMWFATSVPDGTPLAKNDSNGAVDGWYIRVRNSHIKASIENGTLISGSAFVDTGTPQHVCVVFNTGTVDPQNNGGAIYINGVLDELSVAVGGVYVPNTVSLTVGARSTGGFFNGPMLQMRLYPGGLPAESIALLAAGRHRRNTLTVQPLLDLALGECAHGLSGNGVAFIDRSGNGSTATGSAGANTTGLTCLGDTVLQGRGVE